MSAEAFHRTLKYAYLKGKVNKRLDTSLYLLLKFARDKGFEHLMKLEKGKLTGRFKTNIERHHMSNKLPWESVTKTEASTWQVKSSGGTCDYTIVHEVQTCPMQKCNLHCTYCNISVHLYSCNCMD